MVKTKFSGSNKETMKRYGMRLEGGEVMSRYVVGIEGQSRGVAIHAGNERMLR